MLNLTRLIVTAIWISSGGVLSILLANAWGTSGYIIGFLIGFLIAFLLTWLIVLMRNLLLKPFPECRRGKCKTYRDYVWKRGTLYGQEKGGIFRYRCKCGNEYIRDGNRFMQVLSDGAISPYKRYEGKTWVDDI